MGSSREAIIGTESDGLGQAGRSRLWSLKVAVGLTKADGKLLKEESDIIFILTCNLV